MSEQGYPSFIDPTSSATEYNALTFLIRQLLAKINTATLVQVKAVTNSGGVSPVGTVDVLPLVNQQDASGNAVPHGIIYGLPYSRLQGGANAIILDPQIGDIGIAVFANRDISAVKATKGQNNPGSARQFSMSDGMYIGGVLNGVPTNYVQFTGNTINIVSTSQVNVQAPAINLQDSGAMLYKLVNETFMTLFNAHVHTSAAPGVPTSSPVTPMTSVNLTSVTKAE
jgi:hypothetical protein